MIQRFHTTERLSKIVKHNGVAYFCGQVGTGDTVAVQTSDCLDRIDVLLKEAGSDRESILQVIIWLADIRDVAEMNEIWNSWIPQGHAPARACGEAKLGRSELKVEMIVTAAYL